MNANRFEVDYTDNDDLRELLSDLRPGQTTELKIRVTLVEASDERATFDIKKIIRPSAPNKKSEREEEDTGEGVQPSADEPALIVMGKRATKDGEEEVDY